MSQNCTQETPQAVGTADVEPIAESISSVNVSLTVKRKRKRVKENPEYFGFLRSMLLASSRRVGAGDVEDLRDLVELVDFAQDALLLAVNGLRSRYSWGNIGAAVGLSKQGASQRWALVANGPTTWRPWKRGVPPGEVTVRPWFNSEWQILGGILHGDTGPLEGLMLSLCCAGYGPDRKRKPINERRPDASNIE